MVGKTLTVALLASIVFAAPVPQGLESVTKDAKDWPWSSRVPFGRGAGSGREERTQNSASPWPQAGSGFFGGFRPSGFQSSSARGSGGSPSGIGSIFGSSSPRPCKPFITNIPESH
jgi:hypothetical protein